MPTPHKIAIAQIAMHWTVPDNLAAIERAMALASAEGAQLCAFSELAITGFHRQIAREAQPEIVQPAIDAIKSLAARYSMGVAVGTPTFAADGSKLNSHLLVNENGEITASISKRGLTAAEATFFARGSTRPIGLMQGLRCSAVICREVSDLDHIATELQPGCVDLVFVPGALRQDPEKPRTEPPEYVRDIQRIAATTGAYLIQTNWPNALNRPEESIDGGGSVVATPSGDVLFRLPMQASGIGIFNLGDHHFDWYPQT